MQDDNYYLSYFIQQVISFMHLSAQQQAQQAITALQKLVIKSKPGTSTPMKSVPVALFTADAQSEFRYSNKIGLLSLDMDRVYKNSFLRIYDMETLALSFEVQMYYGFGDNYKMIMPNLYAFDYPRGIIAFMFRNKQEAEIMANKIKSQAPKMSQYEQIRKERLQQEKQKKQKNSLLGKFKIMLKGKDKQQEQKHQSVVYNVKKQSSISIDISTGQFNTQDIPPQWQQLFDSLGLSKQDLKNRDVINIIVEQTVMTRAKQQAEVTTDADLQRKIVQVQQQNKDYQIQRKQTKIMNLPPPPPPPPLLGPPTMRVSMASKRGNLMEEIRNNNLKLKHVETRQNQLNLDISDMNRQDRMDHAQKLRLRLQQRKKALNRRQADDSD